MPRRRRLDAELVEQGFFSSADEALRAVMAGDVIDVIGVASDAVDEHVAYPEGSLED